MSVRRPRHRAWQLRSVLAAWLAAFLAIAPFAHASLPAELAAGADAIADSLAAQGADDSGATLAIPPRGSLDEVTLARAATKAPAIRSAVGEPRLAIAAAPALGGDGRPILHRSAVGTGCRPTGPPA